jgi:hypothetical protein
VRGSGSGKKREGKAALVDAGDESEQRSLPVAGRPYFVRDDRRVVIYEGEVCASLQQWRRFEEIAGNFHYTSTTALIPT